MTLTQEEVLQVLFGASGEMISPHRHGHHEQVCWQKAAQVDWVPEGLQAETEVGQPSRQTSDREASHPHLHA